MEGIPVRARTELSAAVLGIAVGGCGFVAAVFPIFESDLFWHLASGRWILEQGAVPRADPFRFTSGEASWVDHEWAFQIVVHLVERAVGLDGLIVLRALALALFALVVFAVGRRAGLAASVSGALALATLLGVRPRFLIRPEIVTLFALVGTLVLLERRWIGRGGANGAVGWRREDASLVLLTVGWVNFHGEAVLAPVLCALFLVGASLGERSAGAGSGRRWLEVVRLPLLLALALLANPYGWRIVEVPLGIRRALSGLRASNPEWNTALESPQPFLFAGMAVVASLALAARRRTGRWPVPHLALPAVALALLALTAVRHQALFFAAAAPFAARTIALLSPRQTTRQREARFAWSVSVLAALVALWCAAPPLTGPLRARHGGLSWGFGLAPGRFPIHAAERLAAAPAVGPIYNELAHGGYLIWRLYPPRKVFIDGRMELEPELLGELEQARADPRAWHSLLRRKGAVGALVRYQPRRVPILEPDGRGGFRRVGESTANAFLFPPDQWQLADWDDETMLLLLPEAAGWNGASYRAVQPEDVAGTMERAAREPSYRAALVAELERKLAEQPDCRLARALRDQVRVLAPAGVGGEPSAPGPSS